jgi:energy-coupling factor transport system permease protein
MLLVGVALATCGFFVSGRRIHRSVYRPEPWKASEWLVAACGIAAAAVMFATARVDPANLNPSLNPLQWPQLAILPSLGILIGALPAWIAPPVERTQRTRRDLVEVAA